MVSDLEHSSEELEDKVAIAQALYKEGLLVIADEASRPATSKPTKHSSSRNVRESDDQDDIF